MTASTSGGRTARRGGRVQPSEYEATVSPRTMRADIESLSEGVLAERCPASGAALRALIARVPSYDVDRRWKGRGALGRFLLDVGRPKRHPNESVDRIDTHDPRYGPGLCRWAGARTQANNRTTTITIYDPSTGQHGPRAQVARNNGLDPAAVRQRMTRDERDLNVVAVHVIAEMLADRQTRAVRRLESSALAPTPEDEAVASGEIPPQPLQVAADPARRIPFRVTLAQREQWMSLYRAHRRFYPEAGFEWLAEFVARYCAVQVHTAQAEMQRLQDTWAGEASDEEEGEWARVEAIGNHFAERGRIADAELPGILHELRGRRRSGAPRTYANHPSDDRAELEADDRDHEDDRNDFEETPAEEETTTTAPAPYMPLPHQRSPMRRMGRNLEL